MSRMPFHSAFAIACHFALTWFAAPRVDCHCQGESEAMAKALQGQQEILREGLRQQSPATPCSCLAASLSFLLVGVILGTFLGAAAAIVIAHVRSKRGTVIEPRPSQSLTSEPHGERGGLEIQAASGRSSLRLLRRGAA